MNQALANAIRQQAEDLKDELKELDHWQDEIAKKREANEKRKIQSSDGDVIPPIRGTVPSLKEAISKMEKSANKDPVSEAKERGNILFQQSKLKEAIEAYTSGINLDPEGVATHVLYGNRALCFLKLDMWRDAERDSSTSVRLNRSYAKGYYRRALSRKQLGDHRGARTDLEAVLALVPNDTNATQELKLITQMLQAERDKTVNPAPKKKIVIAEVDDDDDDDDGVGARDKGNNGSSNGFNGSAVSQEQQRKEHEELERARETQRDRQKSKAREAEMELERRQRIHPRVEIVEEKEEEEEAPLKEEKLPTNSIDKSKVEASRALGDSKRSPLSRSKAPKEPIAPRNFRSITKWTKETLKTPKSFTEFERVFSDIADNEELRGHYLTLIVPESMRTLFGSNMTPDILLGMLRTVRQLDGSFAVAFLKGLCSVKRVEDICLFFDSTEKKVAQDALDGIIASGVSQGDAALFKQKLKV